VARKGHPYRDTVLGRVVDGFAAIKSIAAMMVVME
jgi:hypothetical protein